MSPKEAASDIREAIFTLDCDWKEETAAKLGRIADELDPPQQPAEASVADEMRECADNEGYDHVCKSDRDRMHRWADALEVSEQTARNLAGTAEALQKRVTELEKINASCRQLNNDLIDQVEMDDTGVKSMRKQIAELTAQLEQRRAGEKKEEAIDVDHEF